jgi:hypothetical protein
MHTLIGKNKYLFLINDSNSEIKCHQTNIITNNNSHIYDQFIDKFAMLVYPDKSYVCQEFLPDEYQPLLYRPSYNNYCHKLQTHIFDGLPYITCKDYIKTDTHLNIEGVYKIYSKFIEYVNNLLNVNLNLVKINIYSEDNESNFLKAQYGDLKRYENAGNLNLSDYKDIFYYSDAYDLLYPGHTILENDQFRLLQINSNQLQDKTVELAGKILSWDIMGKYIIYKNNLNICDKKVLVFYDSFSRHIIPTILELSNNVYMCKSSFNPHVINIIQPDIILELRVERFLN